MTIEKPEYYLNTWLCGNKTHVIMTLARLLVSSSVANGLDYTNILSKFIEYDSDLALTLIDKVKNKLYDTQ